MGSHGQMTKGQCYAHYIITKLKWDAYQRVNKCIYIHTFVLKSSKQATFLLSSRKMLYVLINYRELSAPISDSNSFLNKKNILNIQYLK